MTFRHFILVVLLSVLSFSMEGQMPYIVQYSDIQEELKELWHDKRSGRTYAMTIDRLCIIEPSLLKCSSLGIGKNLLYHNQSYDRFVEQPIFLGNYGGFYQLDEGKIRPFLTEEKYPNAAVFKDGETTWIASYELYKIKNERIDTFPVIMNSEAPFWDIRKQSNGTMWFTNYGSGIYICNVESKLRRISNLNGLPTNNISSIHISATDDVYVGYQGGIAQIYNPKKLENFDLSTYIGDSIVKEIETDNHGFLWVITDKHLLQINLKTKAVQLIPTMKQEGFTLHALEYNSQQDLMLIGTSAGLFISNSQGSYFHGDGMLTDGPLYYYGEELLISGKSKVYSFEEERSSFAEVDYRPIEKSFLAKNGDFWIQVKDQALLLDRETKEVTKKFSLLRKKVNQITEVGGSVYVAHETGILKFDGRKTRELISDGEPFYNVLSCGPILYAVSQEGIYKLKLDGELEHESLLDANEEVLKSNRQFFITDQKMLIPAKRSIIQVTCLRDEISFEYFPTYDDILDFYYHKEKLFVLHSDRLITYDKAQFMVDPYKSSCVIPVNADSNSKIFIDAEDRIWLQNKVGLALIGTEQDKLCNILPRDLIEESDSLTHSEEVANGLILNTPTDTGIHFPKFLLWIGIIFFLLVFLFLIIRPKLA